MIYVEYTEELYRDLLKYTRGECAAKMDKTIRYLFSEESGLLKSPLGFVREYPECGEWCKTPCKSQCGLVDIAIGELWLNKELGNVLNDLFYCTDKKLVFGTAEWYERRSNRYAQNRVRGYCKGIVSGFSRRKKMAERNIMISQDMKRNPELVEKTSVELGKIYEVHHTTIQDYFADKLDNYLELSKSRRNDILAIANDENIKEVATMFNVSTSLVYHLLSLKRAAKNGISF